MEQCPNLETPFTTSSENDPGMPRPESYEYSPLPAVGWTRFLRLYPGSGKLVCSLICSKIESMTLKYEAISYVWGADAYHNTVEIECDGKTLYIGSNLASALRHIRSKPREQLLWADAICIKQKDKAERSQQVQQMGDIYASASCVLVWVGEDPNHEADECFALISEAYKAMKGILKEHEGRDLPYVSIIDQKIFAETSKWDLIWHLMSSEWFNRVWTLQEIGLARFAKVMYGDSSLWWHILVELLIFITKRQDIVAYTGGLNSAKIATAFADIWYPLSHPGNAWWARNITFKLSDHPSKKRKNFIDVLNTARFYKATDPRDYVYAFLSHPAAMGYTLTVDYTKSVDEIYLDLASRALEVDSDPWMLLSSVQLTENSPVLSSERPSWVPRWDERKWVLRLGQSWRWYRAGGNSGARTFEGIICRPGMSLQVQGKALDAISWISQSLQEKELDLVPQQEKAPIQSLCREVNHHSTNTIYGCNDQDREHAFSMAIVAGLWAPGSKIGEPPNPRAHRSLYEMYKYVVRRNKSTAKPNAYDTRPDTGLQEEPISNDVLTYISDQRRVLHNRRFFITSKGFYGICHLAIEIGDTCAVFRGANVPFVLRKVPATERSDVTPPFYRLIGEAYIEGIMKGEAYGVANEGLDDSLCNLPETTITMI